MRPSSRSQTNTPAVKPRLAVADAWYKVINVASVTLSDWLGVRAPKEHGSSYQHHAWSIYSAWQSLGISDLLSKGQRSRSQGYRVCCQRRSTARHDCINIMFCFSLAACGDISVESHVRTCTRHGVTIVAPCGSMDRLSEDTRYIRVRQGRQADRQAWFLN